MIGVTQATISRYENGYVRKIPDDVLIKISDALNTSMNDLTEDDPVYSHLHRDKYKKIKSIARNDTDKKLLEWYHKQSPEIQGFIQQIISSDSASL
ncbi:MAG: helix-turn-helix transcriptional regulator [Solobacterium sp.]|nr:helix-turn-helix transcriptional regulator [Solobacterium sp.]